LDVFTEVPTATVKSIDPAAFMDQAGSDYVLAGRVLHAGSIVMTHAVEDEFSEVRRSNLYPNPMVLRGGTGA
jgi:hypothetical protein